jgi:hypothetical protein
VEGEMIKKRGWEERFSERIRREIEAYKSGGDTKENRLIISGLRDCIYLLGESMNKEDYSFANGFQKFLKDMGMEEVFS